MPVLPLEPFVYPDDLLCPATEEIETCARWWVLHTRPRAEKSLARKFLTRGVSFFLPLYQHYFRNRGRTLCSHLPLFPGYVFLKGSNEDRIHALETNLIANCLVVTDQEEMQHDLTRVYQMLTAGTSLSPEERLQPGTRVEIIHGPLTGMEGKVLRRGKHLRFFVEVRFLQQGVSIEVENWMIRPVVE
jgi:transcriptional antiterminator RfaH